MKLSLIPMVLIGGVSSLFGTTISLNEINADSDGSALEGSISGDGSFGSSSYSFIVGPTDGAVASTFADYLVSDLDLDGDGNFGENFSFRMTFSSAQDINFSSTLEVIGVGDESISLGESFSLDVSILSDSSLTHDVRFDGFSALDFVSLAGTDLGITSSSGNTSITLAGSETALGGLFVNPSFSYLGSGNTTNIGTLEDWSIQFSTTPVPEARHIALYFGVFALLIGVWNKRFKK